MNLGLLYLHKRNMDNILTLLNWYLHFISLMVDTPKLYYKDVHEEEKKELSCYARYT